MQDKNGKWLGKLPPGTLSRLLHRLTPVTFPSTIVGPRIGEDAAIIDTGFCDLVMHVDPITEAGALAGWLAVHVASNDIAVTGARPRWLIVTLLLREGASMDEAERIAEEIGRAAREIGVEVVGGHTEATPGLNKTIVQVAAIGCTCRGCSVPTSGARPGDLVVQVKPAGIEGTAIIATDLRHRLLEMGLNRDLVDRAASMYKMVSIVREALELASRGLATAMHDPTEGGLIGGLIEVALASGTSITIDRSKVIIAPETRIITEKLEIDPLKLISSGTLIATIPPSKIREAETILDSMNVEYSIIGVVEERREWILRIRHPAGDTIYNKVPQDEITRVIASA